MTAHRNPTEAKGRRNRGAVTEEEGKGEEDKANQNIKRENPSWLKRRKLFATLL